MFNDNDSLFEFLSNKTTIVSGIVLACLTFSGQIVKKIKELMVELHSFPQRTIIGVVGKATLPEVLKNFPDYTDFRKLKRSKASIVIYYARTLSFALRKCDFVLVEDRSLGNDVKIHSANELSFWSAIASED